MDFIVPLPRGSAFQVAMVNIVLLFINSAGYSANSPDKDLSNVKVQKPSIEEPSNNSDSNHDGESEIIKKSAASKPESFQFRLATLSPRLGLGLTLQKPGAIHYTIGALFQIPKLLNPRTEISLDFTSKRDAYLGITKKWILNSSSPFRQSGRIGFSVWIDPDDGLTNFINYEHFQLLLGGDIEYWLFGNTSLRFGIEASGGIKEQRALGFIGYSWGL